MGYILRKKPFSLRPKFIIKDENGKDAFIVKTKFFSWGKDIKIFNMNGNEEICCIRQEIFRMGTRYTVQTNGGNPIHIKKKISLFKNIFSINDDKSEYILDGDILTKEFILSRDKEPIAIVTKKFLRYIPAYLVRVKYKKDTLEVLGIIIAIDIMKSTHRGIVWYRSFKGVKCNASDLLTKTKELRIRGRKNA